MRSSGGFDAQLGTLFQTMRAALSASPAEAARLLGTTTEVVAALERGDLEQLPEWPETSRVVRRYGDLLRIDVASALDHLQRSLSAMATVRAVPPPTRVQPASRPVTPSKPAAVHWAPSVATFASPPVAAMVRPPAAAVSPPVAAGRSAAAALPARDDGDDQQSLVAVWRGRLSALSGTAVGFLERLRPSRLSLPRPSRRQALTLGLPLGFVFAIGLALAVGPNFILPDGLARSMRAQMDRVNQRVTIGSDGLKWIVVNDPRSRKSDRLPMATRP